MLASIQKSSETNHWSGDQAYHARKESRRCWEYGRTQVSKWTTEGFPEFIVREDVRHTSVVREMLVSCGEGRRRLFAYLRSIKVVPRLKVNRP